MKIIYLSLIFLALLLVGCKKVPTPQNQQVPTQADQQEQQLQEFKAAFAVFTNGTFRIFTDPRYHNKSADVFITADSPNVITVKKSGTTWRNFFGSLPMELTDECLTTGTGQTFCTNQNSTLRFFINGEQKENALDLEIKPGDKLLVSFGSETSPVESELRQLPAL